LGSFLIFFWISFCYSGCPPPLACWWSAFGLRARLRRCWGVASPLLARGFAALGRGFAAFSGMKCLRQSGYVLTLPRPLPIQLGKLPCEQGREQRLWQSGFVLVLIIAYYLFKCLKNNRKKESTITFST